MAAADELYINIGRMAAQGNLDGIMNGIGEADVAAVAHAVRCASENSHIHVLKTLLPVSYTHLTLPTKRIV